MHAHHLPMNWVGSAIVIFSRHSQYQFCVSSLHTITILNSVVFFFSFSRKEKTFAALCLDIWTVHGSVRLFRFKPLNSGHIHYRNMSTVVLVFMLVERPNVYDFFRRVFVSLDSSPLLSAIVYFHRVFLYSFIASYTLVLFWSYFCSIICF